LIETLGVRAHTGQITDLVNGDHGMAVSNNQIRFAQCTFHAECFIAQTYGVSSSPLK